jgi:hypothetical protein
MVSNQKQGTFFRLSFSPKMKKDYAEYGMDMDGWMEGFGFLVLHLFLKLTDSWVSRVIDLFNPTFSSFFFFFLMLLAASPFSSYGFSGLLWQ